MRNLFARLRRRPPDCRQVAELLQSFLDGELPESKTHLVADHLEHCERCGIEASVYREVKASLEQLRTPADSEALERLRRYTDQLATGEVE